MVDRQLAQEAAALWVELFGEAPSPCTDGAAILHAVVENLPTLDYDSFANVALTANGVVTPRRS